MGNRSIYDLGVGWVLVIPIIKDISLPLVPLPTSAYDAPIQGQLSENQLDVLQNEIWMKCILIVPLYFSSPRPFLVLHCAGLEKMSPQQSGQAAGNSHLSYLYDSLPNNISNRLLGLPRDMVPRELSKTHNIDGQYHTYTTVNVPYGVTYENIWNDTEKISMAPAQGWHAFPEW
jgi:hypothetical protein